MVGVGWVDGFDVYGVVMLVWLIFIMWLGLVLNSM